MADKSITKTELVASIASATGQSQATVSGVLDSCSPRSPTLLPRAARSPSRAGSPSSRSTPLLARAANPQTGAEIKIPAGKRVKVTAGSKLKAAVK